MVYTTTIKYQVDKDKTLIYAAIYKTEPNGQIKACDWGVDYTIDQASLLRVSVRPSLFAKTDGPRFERKIQKAIEKVKRNAEIVIKTMENNDKIKNKVKEIMGGENNETIPR